MKYADKPAWEKLRPGEPYFLIRGQDKHAPSAIRAYAALARLSLHHVIDHFVKWQKDNKQHVKQPD